MKERKPFRESYTQSLHITQMAAEISLALSRRGRFWNRLFFLGGEMPTLLW